MAEAGEENAEAAEIQFPECHGRFSQHPVHDAEDGVCDHVRRLLFQGETGEERRYTLIGKTCEEVLQAGLLLLVGGTLTRSLA
ncbi:MAG: hypothetical protein WBF17_19595, partial [Phycisphaerae bacterium]